MMPGISHGWLLCTWARRETLNETIKTGKKITPGVLVDVSFFHLFTLVDPVLNSLHPKKI